MQEPIGVTAIVPQGESPVPVYEDVNGIATFETDYPYLMTGGLSLASPLPVVDAGGAVWINDLGDPVDAMAVTNVPGGTPSAPPVPAPLDYIENGSGIAEVHEAP